MTIDQIRRAIAAKPFKPFTINMADGRMFHVDHPESLLMAPRMERTVVLAFPEEEAYEIIDLFLVSSLTIDQERGRRKRAG